MPFAAINGHPAQRLIDSAGRVLAATVTSRWIVSRRAPGRTDLIYTSQPRRLVRRRRFIGGYRQTGSRTASNWPFDSAFNGSGTGTPVLHLFDRRRGRRAQRVRQHLLGDRPSKKSGHIRAAAPTTTASSTGRSYWHRNNVQPRGRDRTKAGLQLRAYSYTSDGITFSHVRRIGTACRPNYENRPPATASRLAPHTTTIATTTGATTSATTTRATAHHDHDQR
jgi:hypothetical protein